MNLDIKDKIALVTGDSGGLGKAIAFSLAREGAKVAISGRRKEALDETAMEIRNETGAKVLTFVGDMTQKENVTAFVNQVVGSLDLYARLLPTPTQTSIRIHRRNHSSIPGIGR